VVAAALPLAWRAEQGGRIRSAFAIDLRHIVIMPLASNAYLDLGCDFGLTRISFRDRAERTEDGIPAGLPASDDDGCPIEVHDISLWGFKASTEQRLHRGDIVWLRLPGLDALQARVLWMRACRAGFRFDRPLHQTLLSAIAKHLKR